LFQNVLYQWLILPSLNGSLEKVSMAKENHYLELNLIEKIRKNV
jgi:hypothetical protein